jgi:hypothetical protein
MKTSRWLIPAVALAAVLVAGCGGTSAPATPSAASLISGMKTSIQHATSVRMTGTVTTGGQTLRLDLSMTKAGEMSGQIAAGQAAFTVLTTGGKSYIKVTASFLKYAKVPAAACAVMCDKYLLATGSLQSGLTGSISWSQMLDGSSKQINANNMTNTGKVTVNGQPAWALRSTDGGVGYVAAQGTPYLLRISAPKGQTGQIDFSEWNSVTIPPPPPASQVVDINKLFGH